MKEKLFVNGKDKNRLPPSRLERLTSSLLVKCSTAELRRRDGRADPMLHILLGDLMFDLVKWTNGLLITSLPSDSNGMLSAGIFAPSFCMAGRCSVDDLSATEVIARSGFYVRGKGVYVRRLKRHFIALVHRSIRRTVRRTVS